jgi:hypothetical protein
MRGGNAGHKVNIIMQWCTLITACKKIRLQILQRWVSQWVLLLNAAWFFTIVFNMDSKSFNSDARSIHIQICVSASTKYLFYHLLSMISASFDMLHPSCATMLSPHYNWAYKTDVICKTKDTQWYFLVQLQSINWNLTFVPINIIIFQLHTAAFKAYCAIWVRRSSFHHQASSCMSPRESTQRQKVELWARNVR